MIQILADTITIVLQLCVLITCIVPIVIIARMIRTKRQRKASALGIIIQIIAIITAVILTVVITVIAVPITLVVYLLVPDPDRQWIKLPSKPWSKPDPVSGPNQDPELKSGQK